MGRPERDSRTLDLDRWVLLTHAGTCPDVAKYMLPGLGTCSDPEGSQAHRSQKAGGQSSWVQLGLTQQVSPLSHSPWVACQPQFLQGGSQDQVYWKHKLVQPTGFSRQHSFLPCPAKGAAPGVLGILAIKRHPQGLGI